MPDSSMSQLGESSAIVVCKVCGMPVRAVFDAEGELRRVLAPCGHVTMPGLPTVGADGEHTPRGRNDA